MIYIKVITYVKNNFAELCKNLATQI